MANKNKIAPGNVSGDFFVDTTCISCGNCRDLAPTVFSKVVPYYVVTKQPSTPQEIELTLDALVCCPRGSIGTFSKHDIKAVIDSFPRKMSANVYYLGYNAASSAGGKSYFVSDPAGNWMIDSPKFTPRLVEWLKHRGGIKYIFITHRDDVGDAHAYAEEFKAQRVIHRHDLEAQPDAEVVLDGIEPRSFGENLLVIPTPGHTEGHCMLLYDEKVLFAGDVFTAKDGKLEPWSPYYCWYSWDEYTASLERLLKYKFQISLPSHGQVATEANTEDMHKELQRVVKQCQDEVDTDPCSPDRIAFLEMLADWYCESGQPVYGERLRRKINELQASSS